jgi:hypothetical protein
MATVASTASTSTVAVYSFPSAITEAVYPNVIDSRVLKNDRQTVPTALSITLS